jgi:hypothetical protein
LTVAREAPTLPDQVDRIGRVGLVDDDLALPERPPPRDLDDLSQLMIGDPGEESPLHEVDQEDDRAVREPPSSLVGLDELPAQGRAGHL